MSKNTTIWITVENKDRLAEFGKAGESMNTVLGRVLDLAETMSDEGMSP